MIKSITEHIENQFKITMFPGKGNETCIFCGKKTMAVTSDDACAQCFHPDCGKHLTLKQLYMENDPYQSMIQKIFEPCKTELERALSSSEYNKPLNYLVNTRKIHQNVLKRSMIGLIPKDYEPYVYKLALATEQNIQSELDGLKDDQDKSFLNNMLKLAKEFKSKTEIFNIIHNHVVFAYTDNKDYITQLKTRMPEQNLINPKQKNIKTIKFYKSKTGVFKSFLSQKPTNDNIVIVEGEFNALQLQSLAAYNNEDYFNAVAIGGVTTADYKVLKEI